jgi:hypothetical protein
MDLQTIVPQFELVGRKVLCILAGFLYGRRPLWEVMLFITVAVFNKNIPIKPKYNILVVSYVASLEVPGLRIESEVRCIILPARFR